MVDFRLGTYRMQAIPEIGFLAEAPALGPEDTVVL